MQELLQILTKHLFFILLVLIGFSSCKKAISTNANIEIETLNNKLPVVSTQLIQLKNPEGKAYFKNQVFTGFAVTLYENNADVFHSKTKYINGIKNGSFEKWYEDGTLSYQANYKDGYLNGTVKSWWKDGTLRSESYYKDGLGNGKQLQYYKNGNIFKSTNLTNGKEEGLQQSWRRNGKLYNNYEAKNGRIFGLKRASLCFQLENEQIQKSN